MAKVPVLFDTDIGSNIDDAVALAYLLRQRQCELLGITTVTGRPDARAMLADAVCRAFGRGDVPIFGGADKPMAVPQRQLEVPQAAVLPRWPHRGTFASNAAVEFLRQTIRSRPGEVTLLTVGPLTNVGLLYTLDPEVPSLLRQHVMMGGHYLNRAIGYGPTERNMGLDPHAAAIVFGAPVPGMTCVGLDVTTHCRLPADEFRRRFSAGPQRIVGEMAEEWLQDRPVVIFHDPLAAASVFEPSLCDYADGRVDIDPQDARLPGFTAFDSNARPAHHRVATAVRSEEFFEHYFSIVSA